MMNYAFLCNDNKHSQREAISTAYFNIRILLHQKVRKAWCAAVHGVTKSWT